MTAIDSASSEFVARLGKVLPVAVIATDATGTVVEWSSLAESIYGWTAEETLGKSISSLTVDPLDVGVASKIMEQVSEGRSWSGTYHARTKSGEIVEVYVIDAPMFDDEGNIIGIIGCSWRADANERSATPRWIALRNVASEIITVRDRERTETARKLHDDIGQALAMIRLEVAGLHDNSNVDAPTMRRLDRLIGDLDMVNKTVRELSSNLFLKDFDVWLLVIRLYEIAEDINDREMIFTDCEVNVPVDYLRLIRPEIAYSAYNIARESVFNAVRHSQGDHLKITLRLDGDDLLLEVVDNGVGIGSSTPGVGRSLIHEGAVVGRGEVTIVDRSGEGATGTRVTARFPLGEAIHE